MTRTVKAVVERRPLKTPLHITGHSFDTYDLLYVEVHERGLVGRGEAWGVYFKGETAASMLRQINAVIPEVSGGVGRLELLDLLPAGGARNALDCALWELDSKKAEKPVSVLAGLAGTRPVQTMYTISADAPEKMVATAMEFGPARTLKLKLTGTAEDAQRVSWVAQARPDLALIVDANQGFTPASLEKLLPTLLESRVELIEQPFPVGREQDLDVIRCPIPIAADEAACDIEDLEKLRGRVQAINIKLDKCGGLTRGLQMAQSAKEMGFDLMVGCMLGTSLGAAPGFILAQLCRYVDMDLVLRCVSDRSTTVKYTAGWINCEPQVWGYAPA